MEHRGEMLPVPVTSGGKGKTMKKDDQYKIMFTELETYIKSHCRTEKHFKVLNCLLESRNRPAAERPPGMKTDNEWELANRELDKYNKMTEREKSDFNQRKSAERSRSPSPSSRPPAAKRVAKSNKTGESLLDLWMKSQKENSKSRFTVPFVGMRSVGEKARLYLSLERKDKDFNSGGPGFGET